MVGAIFSWAYPHPLGTVVDYNQNLIFTPLFGWLNDNRNDMIVTHMTTSAPSGYMGIYTVLFGYII